MVSALIKDGHLPMHVCNNFRYKGDVEWQQTGFVLALNRNEAVDGEEGRTLP